MPTVWSRCTLRTRETIEFDRCDPASEKKEIKMQTENKQKIEMIPKKKIKIKKRKNHGNRKENEITN
jgi:hypothetical protein